MKRDDASPDLAGVRFRSRNLPFVGHGGKLRDLARSHVPLLPFHAEFEFRLVQRIVKSLMPRIGASAIGTEVEQVETLFLTVSRDFELGER